SSDRSKASPSMFVSCPLFSFGTVCCPTAQPLSSSTEAKSSANTLRYIAFPPFRGSGAHSASCPPRAMQWRTAGAFFDLGSTHIGGERLIDELLQCLRLLLFRDGAYDGFTHDIAAAVDHIGGGIGKDVGGKLSRLTIGVKIHILIGGALLGQHVLRLGNRCLVAVQREGVDADEGAALLREFLIQRVQLGKLSHAGIAGGEPEIHYGDGVAGEQLVALHRVAIQVFTLKGGELLHTAVVGRGARVAARGHTHIAVHGFLHDLGILLFQLGQLVFNITDLRGRLLQPLILLVGELLFRGLDGIQQEVAVVFAVLLHGHALIG
ncbi:Glutathione import ATP-binding protein GsiA, partial [Dysosmobacter welbionis]